MELFPSCTLHLLSSHSLLPHWSFSCAPFSRLSAPSGCPCSQSSLLFFSFWKVKSTHTHAHTDSHTYRLPPTHLRRLRINTHYVSLSCCWYSRMAMNSVVTHCPKGQSRNYINKSLILFITSLACCLEGLETEVITLRLQIILAITQKTLAETLV